MGWKASGAFVWETEKGTRLDVRVEAPSTVLKQVRRSIEAMIWREWAEAPSAKSENFLRDADGYWTEELRRWTAGPGKDWTSLQAACLSSTAAGGQWPQERLYLAGFVDDPACQACGRGAGTVGHRTWECRCLHAAREQGIDQDILKEAQRDLATNPHHPFWTRGLVPAGWLPSIPAVGNEQQRWYRGVVDGCFTGNVYTDGSLKQRRWWPTSVRAGWGIAMLTKRPPLIHHQQQQHQTTATHTVVEGSTSSTDPVPIHPKEEQDPRSEQPDAGEVARANQCILHAVLNPPRLAPRIPPTHPLYRPPPRPLQPPPGLVRQEFKLADALFGTLPGPEQTVPRAEMWAICEALRRAILPICIHTDHQPILTGLESGKTFGWPRT